MPAVKITTYDELLAAGSSWLNRGDLDDQMPAFVTLAEAQFNRELRLRDMMVRTDCTSDQEMVELPDDFLEHYSLVVAPGPPPAPPGYTPTPLRYMSEKESNAAKAAAYGQGGPPTGYTLIGNAFELVLAPAGDVNLKMVYYARIPDLSTSVQSNWLLAKSPDLYLYSTCMQAEPYLKNDDRLQTWAAIRSSLMENMRMESEAAMRPRSGLIAMAKAF